MSVLSWDKPKRKQTVAKWRESYGFEDGPTGGYVPNMSDKDKRKWKAKLVGAKTDYPQVEIRKSSVNRVQMTVIVSLGKGYNYKYYRVENTKGQVAYYTKGVNVHIALNGGMQLTFAEMAELNDAVLEAKKVLEDLIETAKETDK